MWPFTSSSATPATEHAPPPASACPVDHETRAAWSKHSSNPVPHDVAHKDPLASRLSTEREVSSIPRWLPASADATSSSSPSSASGSAAATADTPPAACPMHESNVNASANSAEQAATIPSESNWVYPSPASFYTALERKHRNPRAQDMDIVVPIHNAVNERVWHQVLEWERAAMGLQPGQETGSRLVSFVGKPKQMSPRARWKSLIGYTEPFDRHDWIVDRPLHPPSAPSPSSSAPSTTLSLSPSASSPPTANNSSPENGSPESIRIRYVIDFYTGRGKNLLLPPPPSSSSSAAKPPAPEEVMVPNLAFFIDCRPALDGWEGLRMRFNKYWGLDSPTAANAFSGGGTAARTAA